MECRVVDHVMDEYVDGRLAPKTSAAVDRHLVVCPACRELAVDLRRLLAATRDLPSEVEPPRELWERIAGELGTRRTGRLLTGRFGALTGGWMGGMLAAAAAVALVVATVVVVRQGTGPDESARWRGEWSGHAVPAALAEAGLDDELVRVRHELRDALEARRKSLAPETAAVIDENLAIIEWALAEIEQALEADPANRQLVRLFVATYQQEVDLLTQVTLAPAA